MGRGMFMQPQMQQMLQMRDQMRMQRPMPSAQDAQIGYEFPETQARQMQPQEMSTEDSLMQVQQALTNMQQQQQQLSQHLGAGSATLQQYQGGLGGLMGQLRPQPATLQTQGPMSGGGYQTRGPESLRLRTQGPTNTMYQGNPFGA